MTSRRIEDDDDDLEDQDYIFEVADEDDDEDGEGYEYGEVDEDYVDEEDEDDEDGDEDGEDDLGAHHGPTITLAELFADAADGETPPAGVRQLIAFMQALQGGAFRSGGGGRPPRTPSPIPEPDREKGKELLDSGEFGRVDSAYLPSNRNKRSLVQKLWMRELTPRSVTPTTIGESVLPANPGKVIAAYSANAYCGGYSEDGSLFASCDRDWQLRIYRTAGSKLIPEKVIQGMPGRWTITDHNLSLDNHWLIYSSLTPYVYLTRTEADAPEEHHQLDFTTSDDDEDGEARLWSIRFSGDGREIIAGGQNKIYVYDIESRTVLHSVLAHNDDVNAVCFAEPSSSQVLFSGSDDGLVKVWDRRSMRGGRNSTPSGVLVGHSEGITYVTSKGDNRYLASNGKDQKMLLWDLRMMYSKQEFADLPRRRRPMFDYRTTQYRGSRSTKVPGDCSVMSFQGHEVLRTLIRCHFSPVHTTGQRYLYSGSSDGMVHIYRLDGTLVRKLDTNAAFENYTKSPDSTSVARDVSWHPHYPTLISSCSGDMDYGFRASALSGGLVQHTFTRRGEMGEMDLGEVEDVSDTELPPRPRQRRRFGW